MRKAYVLFFACCAISLVSISQPVIFINAGSRASRGNFQELTIDANGNGKYRLREMNGPLKDSSSFMISGVQVDSLLSHADQSGFFILKSTYSGTTTDGAGIYLSLNKAGKKHSVDVRNTDLPEIYSFVELLNRMLEPARIRINYGQFVINDRR